FMAVLRCRGKFIGKGIRYDTIGEFDLKHWADFFQVSLLVREGTNDGNSLTVTFRVTWRSRRLLGASKSSGRRERGNGHFGFPFWLVVADVTHFDAMTTGSCQ